VLDYREDVDLGAVEQVDREEVARQDRLGLRTPDWDQAGPVRRGAESIPALFRISHIVDAATFSPRPASSPWILR
jgi:hypothetical protein